MEGNARKKQQQQQQNKLSHCKGQFLGSVNGEAHGWGQEFAF